MNSHGLAWVFFIEINDCCLNWGTLTLQGMKKWEQTGCGWMYHWPEVYLTIDKQVKWDGDGWILIFDNIDCDWKDI